MQSLVLTVLIESKNIQVLPRQYINFDGPCSYNRLPTYCPTYCPQGIVPAITLFFVFKCDFLM